MGPVELVLVRSSWRGLDHAELFDSNALEIVGKQSASDHSRPRNSILGRVDFSHASHWSRISSTGRDVHPVNAHSQTNPLRQPRLARACRLLYRARDYRLFFPARIRSGSKGAGTDGSHVRARSSHGRTTRHATSGKQVRLVRQGLVVKPEAETRRMKTAPQHQLWPGVFPPYTGHHPAAYLRCDNINHVLLTVVRGLVEE